MAQVYIDKDDAYMFFMWDQKMFNILGYRVADLREVPDELVLEYTDLMEQVSRMQEKLRKYYESDPIN